MIPSLSDQKITHSPTADMRTSRPDIRAACGNHSSRPDALAARTLRFQESWHPKLAHALECCIDPLRPVQG